MRRIPGLLLTWREVGSVAISTLLVGVMLFALPPFADRPLGYQIAAAGAALAVWCYTDGIIGRLSWGLAVTEGLLRLKAALAWTAFLLEMCREPAV